MIYKFLRDDPLLDMESTGRTFPSIVRSINFMILDGRSQTIFNKGYVYDKHNESFHLSSQSLYE